MKTYLRWLAAVCVTVHCAAPVRGAVPAAANREKELAAVLVSNADLKAKMDACRELSRVGSAASVPALAALLPDPELSHMARVALETIPDRAAGEALLKAMDKTAGLARVGVIESLGHRREATAVSALVARMSDPDPAIAAAAARALGMIGGEQVVRALQQAMAQAAEPLRAVIGDALLRCAESAGSRAARDVYDALRSGPAPAVVKLAALRGAIAARGADGAALVLETLRGTNAAEIAVALRAAYELPGADATRRLGAALGSLPGPLRPAIIEVLAVRGDEAAAPALLAAAKDGDTPLRLAAIRALVRLGADTAVPVIAPMALDADPDLAAGARAALASMPGSKADAAVLALLDHTNANVRAMAVDLTAHRSPRGAGARLLRAAADPHAAVRKAALRALRSCASAADVSALLDLLRSAPAKADADAIEAALSALVAREARKASAAAGILKAVYGDLPDGPSADVTRKLAEKVRGGDLSVTANNQSFGDPAPGRVKKLTVTFSADGGTVTRTVNEGETIVFPPSAADPACLDPILKALPSAAPEVRAALLRAVAAGGGPRAFEAVRAALQDVDAGVRGVAARILAEWPTPRALPVLMEMAREGRDPAVVLLALRGAIRLVPRTGQPPDAQIAALDGLAGQIRRDEERKLLLAALGEIPSPAALERAMAHIDSPVLKAEAAAAAVNIGEKIAEAHPDLVSAAMKKARTTAEDKSLARRASVLMRETKAP